MKEEALARAKGIAMIKPKLREMTTNFKVSSRPESIIKKLDLSIIKKVTTFDIFEGQNIPEGKKSIAINEVSIFRQSKQTASIKIELKKKSNFDEAIKSLKPPIFWKDKDHFKNHCTKWPARSISWCISTLVEAEYKCKSESELSNEFCENYILKIAQQGHSYFK